MKSNLQTRYIAIAIGELVTKKWFARDKAELIAQAYVNDVDLGGLAPDDFMEYSRDCINVVTFSSAASFDEFSRAMNYVADRVVGDTDYMDVTREVNAARAARFATQLVEA